MQPKMRLCVSRSSLRPHSERGAIAVMAAVVIAFILFPMLGLVTMSGFFFNAQKQVTNYADSVSAAWGLQMAQMSRAHWVRPYFDGQDLARGHGYTSNMPTASPPIIPPTPESVDQYDRYNPAYVAIDADAPYGLANLTRAWFPGFKQDLLRARSRRRINQVTLASNVLFRQPVMLMMDFSSTMSLNYVGRNGTTSADTAAQALQRVAKQLIDDSTYVYDLGVMGFSDGTSDASQFRTPAGDTNQPNAQAAWMQEQVRRSGMAAEVQTWQPIGDGTDIEGAITRAGGYLLGSEHMGFPLQKPMMIIITDGEPNLGSSAARGSGGSLQQRQQAAASDALRAMGTQRDMTNQGIPSGVDALVLQIQREQRADLGEEDEAFLRALAGPASARSGGDSNYFHQDGGDPNELSRFMQRMPKYPFCEFSYNLRDMNSITQNNAAPPVPNRDVLAAFVAFDDQLDEIAIDGNNIFTSFDKYRTWAMDPAHAAYLTYGSDPAQQTITSRPVLGDNTEGIEVLRRYPNQFLALWLDPTTSKVYVGGMLCAALNLPRLNSNRNIRLRLRWGYPQLAADGDQVRPGR